MRTFLTSLVEVSLTMSVVTALLLLLGRALEKRFAPQWRYWAWLVVALRLCVPVNVSLPRAPVVLPAPPQAAVRVERPAAPAAGGPALAWNTSPQAGEPGPVYEAGDAPGQTVEVRRIPADTLLFALWCAGCAGFLVVQVGGYLAFRRRVRRWSRPVGAYDGLPVLACDAVDSPLLMGLFRPVILVPAAGADEFALLHEASHARRRDLWYKLLLVLCNAVHWFNPLVWALRHAAARDVEIACDAALLKGKDEDYRRAYGHALLRTVAAGRKPGGALTSAFSGGKKSLKQRFASLMDMSPKKAGRAALVLLCAAALLSGSMVACGGGKGLTVPKNGTVYANSEMSYLFDNSGASEEVTLTVVDYDRDAGSFHSPHELVHTFTMAEVVTVHHETTGAEDSVIAGTPGDQERGRELASALLWPTLSSVYYEDSTWLLELHLTDGKVDELGWFLHRDQFPKGDVYDEESGLYFCPHVGMGTILPGEIAKDLAVLTRVTGEREGAVYFLDRQFVEEAGLTAGSAKLDRYALLILERFGDGISMVTPGREDQARDLPEDETLRGRFRELAPYAEAMGQRAFQVDGVQILEGGGGDVDYTDPVSGAGFTIPGRLAEGLVVFSVETGTYQAGDSGPVLVPDGGYDIWCLQREMLDPVPIRGAADTKSGVFTLHLGPGTAEPRWSWEESTPDVTLSGGAERQCRKLREAREAIEGSFHQDRADIPEGDLFDAASGLYYSPYAGAGTVVPEALRGTFSAARQEGADGTPGVWFYASAEQDEAEKLVWMTCTECTMQGVPDDAKQTLFDQWFSADGVQILDAGAGEVYDPVSGVRLTLPGELAGGLVLISARTTVEEAGVSGRKVERDGGSWLVCLHREMLGQILVPDAVANRSGVFALGFVPEAMEPLWSFGWEGRYPWLELSGGARKQCEGLLEAREDIAASLDTAATALLAQNWVMGVEYLDLLPAESGTVTYQSDAFGFTVAFPAGAAEHLMAVTTDRGAGWVYLGTATLDVESSAPIPPELEARTRAMSEAVGAGRAVTFVDRRLLARLGAEYAPQALSGGWAGRIVVWTEPDAPPTALEELESGGGYHCCYAPTFLSEEVLALAEPPVPVEERTAVLRTAEEVSAAVRTLRPPAEETRTPLEGFVPDELTAVFDGPVRDAGKEEIYWYRLRLAFHFDGTAWVDLENDVLHYQLEFEEDSPLRALIGFEPFTSGGRVERPADGRSWALNLTMGNNAVTAAGLARVVAQDPSCTLRVTDRTTGESRVFPLEVKYEGDGGKVVYALHADYDAAENTLRYSPIQVDERDMSFEAGDGATETAPLADGVRLIGGYAAEGDGVQSFLDSWVLFSSDPMGLSLTIEEGEITVMEWVWLQSPAGETAEMRVGVVHEVDVDGNNVSGFWLDEGGTIDFDAPFSLPVAEGANIQLLDGAGRYGEPVGLKELEERVAPLSSWGLSCELSILDGAVRGIVEAG